MGTLVFQATLGGAVNIIGPNIASTINFTLPSADGTSGQTWTTNGSGVLSFGTLGIAGGGTGQITATAAFNALAPSQSGQSGKYLTTDGTNTSWGTNPLGTVTSVAATVPSFLSIAGSPITTSGTLAFTLSGTALPTTSGGTGLTSFTSGGVVYASSSSALATGSALQFNGSVLSVSVPTGILKVESTTGTNASYLYATNTGGDVYFGRDNSTGSTFSTGSAYSAVLYSAGAYPMVFFANATESMRLTSTVLSTPSAISFGIGTSSPSAKLHVSSTYASDTTAQTIFSDNTGGRLNFGGNASAGKWICANDSGTSTAVPLIFQNGSNVERMRLDTAGNLGIGTSSPTAKIEVVAGTGNVATATFRTGDATAANNAGGGFFANSSATAGSRNARLWLDADGANFSGSDYFYIDKTGNSGEVALIQQSNAAMTFQTNGTERARIDSSGRFAIAVAGDAYSQDAGLTVNGTGFTRAIYTNINGTSTSTHCSFANGNGVVGSITTSGSATLYNVTSDERLKENIANADSASSLIDSLQVRKFDWKADSTHQRYGFVAQELVTVAPEAVYQPNDTDEMMAVDYSKLVPMLVKEIQSLRQRLSAANL
jgi:hypothetical protein